MCFSRLQNFQAKTRRLAITEVKNLSMGVLSVTPPPMSVLAKLGCPSFIVGVDIETADWVDRKRSATRKGQFGFYHFCHDDDFNQRIVQIGWAAGEARDGAPLQTYKEILVRPEGFVISEKATAKHSICQERAIAEGTPLREALECFMEDMKQIDRDGGRIIIHHLEFDAGIIARELLNAGLQSRMQEWMSIARKGICTMDPDIGRWVQKCMGRDVQTDEKSAPMLSLKDAVNMLLPRTELVEALQSHCHTAGADAQLHRLLYIAFKKLCEQAA